MNVIVTGGLGFIGSRLIDYLYNSGTTNIVCIDDSSVNSPRRINVGIKYVDASILDTAKIESYFEDIDIVFHLAALISVSESFERQEEYYKVNVEGTRNILDLCEKYNVGKFVFTSSISVHGSWENINEDSCFRPSSVYAQTKIDGENLCHLYHGNTQCVILRLSNVFGWNQDADRPFPGCIASFMKAVKQNLPFEIHGNGKQRRDYICVSDIIRIMIVCANRGKTEHPLIVICGSGECVSVLELAKLIDNNRKMVTSPSRINDPSVVSINNWKLTWQIGYKITDSLSEQIKTEFTIQD